MTVAPVASEDEPRSRAHMDEHHYLGAPWKISQTVWYAADDGSGAWPALAAFTAAALKCSARDAWIGWRFLALCARRIGHRDIGECVIQIPCLAPAD